MIIERIQRVANPTRKKRSYSKARRKTRKTNPGKRRIKLSAKQIAAGFGGKRRKVARKVARRRKSALRASNPTKRKKRRVVVRKAKRVYRAKAKKNPTVRRKKRAYRRSRNPSIMALGYLNPERTAMKTRKKRSHRRRATKAPVRRRRYVAKNPSTRRYRRHTRRHRNPDFLGNGMEAVGVLVGVAIQKIAKGFIPASLVSGNAMIGVAASVALAFAIGKGADMIGRGKPITKGIALGALAAAASDAVSVFVPSLSGTVGLNGFGVYQNALFAVPENPIMRGLPAPSVPIAAKGMGGALAAAFGNSF